MKIALLPLDSRPCNVLFPHQLAAWCHHECLLPAKADMDFFTAPAAFEASRAFMLRSAEAAEALVVSVDHLCYGSLLASRSDEVALPLALERLDFLRELHRLFPQKPVYAYSVIMRSSISALYCSDLTAYNAMTEYSVYTDRAAQTGDPADHERAQAARALIPQAVLTRYQHARARNHAVNLRCVELAAQGVVHSLALLQEDAQPFGFHRQEQRALLQAKASPNVWLHNGADEGGALTVMKAIAQKEALSPIAVAYLGCPDGDFVACYEDRPFRENVNDSLDYAGLTVHPQARIVLAVCAPPDGRQTDWENPACAQEYRTMAAQVARLVQDGRQVYLLDQTRANGGSPTLMRAVHELLGSMKLAGYSAWNTASNALGTAIAQIMSDQLAGQINTPFLWERLLDDLAYQGAVRACVNARLEACGEDPLHLSHPRAAQRLAADEMAAWLHTEPLFEHVPAWRLALPWNRTFEADVRLQP